MYTRWIAVEQEPGFAAASGVPRAFRPGHVSLLRRDPACTAGSSPHAFLLQTPRFELFREFLTLFTHELVEGLVRPRTQVEKRIHLRYLAVRLCVTPINRRLLAAVRNSKPAEVLPRPGCSTRR